MSYVSLYRKYRSQTFDDVIGQDHVVRTIKNAIKNNRIGHGYLFCGSRGTGKTTVARLIAKALNCEHGPTPEPCNACDACESITRGNAVDVIEMDAASNRSVKDIEQLREGVKYPPMRLRYKVYIIDEAHQLSSDAKDAFLKTLEEPPSHAVFILATTESNKIPITIRSRCQQFDFRRGTIDEISGRLQHITSSEKVNIEPDALELIARAANGSYRDSLSLLEQVMAYTDGDITTNDVYTVSGMVDEDALLEIGDMLTGVNTAAAFTLAERLMREGRDVRELLRSIAGHFRDVLELKVGASDRRSGDQRWQSQAESFTQERLISLIDIFAAAEKDLRWNEQHRLAREMALLKAMARPRSAPAQAPSAAPSSASTSTAATRETRPRPAVPPPPPPTVQSRPPAEVAEEVQAEEIERPKSADISDPAQPEPAQPAGPLTLSEVRRVWPRVLEHIKKVQGKPDIEAMARNATPVQLTDSALTLGFTVNFQMQKMKEELSKVQQALFDILGAKLKVSTMLVTQPAADETPPEPPLNDQVARPLLDAVQTMFGGDAQDDESNPWKEQ
ncbi:MAG: DNA polymerase III subunit gamma/tau [Armatimonadetes bacterium]|nr:DNA polymerase III subunit gamma/tau [Armatimonadota bacterium]